MDFSRSRIWIEASVAIREFALRPSFLGVVAIAVRWLSDRQIDGDKAVTATARCEDGPGHSLSHLQEGELCAVSIVRHDRLLTAWSRHLGSEHLKHTW